MDQIAVSVACLSQNKVMFLLNWIMLIHSHLHCRYPEGDRNLIPRFSLLPVGTGRREPWERGWGWPLKGGSRRSCVYRCHTAVYQGQGIVAGCWTSVSTLAMWSSALTTKESISCPRTMVGRQGSIYVEEKWAPQTAQVIATRDL